MTNGELHDYIRPQLENFSYEGQVSDWRPASDMYIDDIVKYFPAGDDLVPVIPMGIRFWLKNGDSIIYVKKQDPPKKSHITADELKEIFKKSIVGGGRENRE